MYLTELQLNIIYVKYFERAESLLYYFFALFHSSCCFGFCFTFQGYHSIHINKANYSRISHPAQFIDSCTKPELPFHSMYFFVGFGGFCYQPGICRQFIKLALIFPSRVQRELQTCGYYLQQPHTLDVFPSNGRANFYITSNDISNISCKP